MKNKILTLLCMIMFIIGMLGSNVFATITSSKCTLNTTKNQYNVGEEVVATFRLESLDADKGIISYSAVLDYDKTALEYVGCSGIGKWVNPSYNEDNGMLVADRNEDYSPLTGEDLCTITFKTIKANVNNVKIKLSEITLANGGHGVGTSDDLEIFINITGDTENPDNDNPNTPGDTDKPSNPDNDDPNPSGNNNPSNPNDNNNNNNNNNNQNNSNNPITGNNNSSNSNNNNNSSSNNNNKNSNTNANSTLPSANKQIPKLGTNTYLITLIGIDILVAIIIFIRMKLIDKKIKKNSEDK